MEKNNNNAHTFVIKSIKTRHSPTAVTGNKARQSNMANMRA